MTTPDVPAEDLCLDKDDMDGDELEQWIGEPVEPEHDLDQDALKGINDGVA